MKKVYRLAAEKDFKQLFSKGRRTESSLFRAVARKNNLEFSRFAFVAPKTVEKRAVIRNRLRRRAREWTRKHLGLIPRSLDLALIFKKEAVHAPKKLFYEELAQIITRL